MTQARSDNPARIRGHVRPTAADVLELLGSMNFAITLLVAVAVASVIGTVLQQNQPYTDYVAKFGPFWFEVFRILGLYDVYSAAWFLGILAFLVASTSVCLYRNTPTMLREMRRFGEHVRDRSLRAFTHSGEWRTDASADETATRAEHYLRRRGFQVRRSERGEAMLLAAKKGAFNRLGYVLTHAAIVIICVGGLIDGNVPLKLRELAGQLEIETRDIAASEVPAQSRLAPGNASFRASVTVPEGRRANIAFLNLRDGYLVQELPFAVEVEEFRVRHYSTGQPKSFESDLVIHDDQLDEPLRQTIAVNEPLTYRGHTIYQASFGDGGSRLNVRLWSLDGARAEPLRVEGEVFESERVDGPDGPLAFEFTDFTMFNVNPVPGTGGETEMRNLGPSFTFKVRDETGQAREYENYMSPVTVEGADYYLSGVRRSPGEPFRYLHVPAGPDGGLEPFMRFNAALHDDERVREVAARAASRSVNATDVADAGTEETIRRSLHRLVVLFREGGFDAVAQHVEQRVPEARRDDVLGAYLRVLQQVLWELYVDTLGTSAEPAGAQSVDQAGAAFFDRALTALAALPRYGTPYFAELEGFRHVQASGLQIAKAPGKNVVYVGCALLIAGVFVMFYVRFRRLWVWIERAADGTRVLIAGSENRSSREFAREFDALRAGLERRTRGSD